MIKWLVAIIAVACFSSCLSPKNTSYDYYGTKEELDKMGYQHASFFPFSVNQPYYYYDKDVIFVSTFLVLADSSLKIELHSMRLSVINSNDSISLKEIKAFEQYSYPGVTRYKELNIHFDYSVIKKTDGSRVAVKEDFKLLRHKNSFRTFLGPGR